MRAVVCSAFNGPSELTFGELPEPRPGPTDVLIDVRAASVTFMDYLMVSGQYQMRPPTPFAPGTDAAGIVVEVGKDVTRFEVGDRVACGDFYGAYAERVAVSQWFATRIPETVTFEVASTIRHVYGTAWYALVERGQLKAGETVFVTGAAGGVGLATVDLARHLGAKVIAGVGSDDKVAIVRRYGASEVINYRTEDVRERIRAITGNRGVDICFEMIGGEIFDQMTRLIAWNGRLMPIGFVGGKIPSVPMNLPLLKNYSIVGVFYGAAMRNEPEATALMYDKLMRLAADGSIQPFVQTVMRLDQAVEAMHMVANRQVQGRVVLRVQSEESLNAR
jgi:NADPH2:quinone reductase